MYKHESVFDLYGHSLYGHSLYGHSLYGHSCQDKVMHVSHTEERSRHVESENHDQFQSQEEQNRQNTYYFGN